MSKGESRYNPSDRQVKHFEFKTLPTGPYTLQSKGQFLVKKSSDPGSIPYVFGMATALDTKDPNDSESKDASVMMPFYLNLTPSGENKTPAIDQGGGLTELIQTLNLTPPEDVLTPVTMMQGTGDEAVEVEVLSAKRVSEWLNSLGNFVVRTQVSKRPPKDGYNAKNQIDYFIPDEVNHVDGQEAPAAVSSKKKK